MLNDALLIPTGPLNKASHDRRRGCRVPFPAEIVLLWHHDPAHPVRYRLCDASDGGLRIRTAVPLTEGMTGMATKLLPDGRSLDRPVMVAWLRPADGDEAAGQFDAGLRFF